MATEHPRRRRFGCSLFEIWCSSSAYWRCSRKQNEHAERQDDQDYQAPSLNLATAMITRTMNESTEAVPLMASLRLQWSSRCVR